MIKKLRIKLIAVSMLAMFIVLGTIVTAINIINYNRAVSDADSILSVLEQNDGKFPEPDFLNESGKLQPSPSENDITAPFDGKEHFRRSMDPLNNPETRFESRFFSISSDDSGNTWQLISLEVAAIRESEALELAKHIYTSGKEKGFYGDYRFLRSENDDKSIVIFLDCARSLGNVRNTLLISILVSLLGFAAVFVLLLIFSRRIVRPVSESYEKQKEFITNAGHEIKTPLSIIGADAEVIEMENGESEWTGDIKSQIKRLASLTDDLIFLARMEESKSANVTGEFSLSDLVRDTVTPFKAQAVTGKKTFAMDIEDSVNLNGEKDSVEKLVSILLDNALKYTPEGGYIHTSLSRQKNKIILSVTNTVKDNLDSDNLEHFFDRFYRSEKSRNSKTGGHGIGLSVADAVVKRHKGRIRAFAKDKKLLCIEAVF